MDQPIRPIDVFPLPVLSTSIIQYVNSALRTRFSNQKTVRITLKELMDFHPGFQLGMFDAVAAVYSNCGWNVLAYKENLQEYCLLFRHSPLRTN